MHNIAWKSLFNWVVKMRANSHRILGGLGIVFLVLIYYYLQWGNLETFVASIDHCDALFCDFSRVFYKMGETIFSQKIPSRGFYYSPFAAIFFSLWGFQPPITALITWGITQLILLVGMFLCWLPVMQKSQPYFGPAYLFLLLTAFPVLHNFKWGQVSVMITLAIFLTMELYQSRQWVWAAFFLAFSVAFKFYPVIFILYFVFKRDVKFLAAFIIFLFLLGIVIPAVFNGFEPTISFYLSILKKGVGFSNTGSDAINSLYFPNVILRLVGKDSGSIWFQRLQILGFVVAAANILLVMFVATSNLARRLQWSFLLLFVSIPFFVSTSWAHYFVYLPAFLAWAVFVVTKSNLSFVKYILLFFSMLFSSIIFFNILRHWSAYAIPGYLFWSNLLLLLAAYLELVPQLRISNMFRSLEKNMGIDNRREASASSGCGKVQYL
ncbi:MAG: hypothetical protein PGMFKBFP_01914 [Anaerolineales bacterium]|jgi:hypothetical protein|nr:hypothetical protein [Anaerolineales bacterium]MBW7919221.1 DUF2029 domain-containing protein [Anaerolineales bacterium]MCZ2287675.1 DUF2029 domain-containing protein [Anaerolineales bacterium]